MGEQESDTGLIPKTDRLAVAAPSGVVARMLAGWSLSETHPRMEKCADVLPGEAHTVSGICNPASVAKTIWVPVAGAACASPTLQFEVAEPIKVAGEQTREEIEEADDVDEVVFTAAAMEMVAH